MDLNLNEAPWKKKQEEIIRLVSDIRRTNGSTPSLDEALRLADDLLKQVKNIKSAEDFLIFLLKNFDLKNKPTIFKGNFPSTQKPKLKKSEKVYL